MISESLEGLPWNGKMASGKGALDRNIGGFYEVGVHMSAKDGDVSDNNVSDNNVSDNNVSDNNVSDGSVSEAKGHEPMHDMHSMSEAHKVADVKVAHPGHENRGHQGHQGMLDDFKRRLIWSLVLTVPVLALSPAIQEFFSFNLEVPGSNYILFALSTLIYIYGGYPFLKGFAQEIRDRNPGMMTLVAVAISVAYFYSAAVTFGLPGMAFFWEIATLIDIMLLGHFLEMRSVMGASRALEELVRIMPSQAHLISGSEIREIGIEELKPGDMVLIKPGEKVPVDGTVVEGTTDVNEAMLTGESRPVAKKPGDKVIGGSINGDGSVTVTVEKTGSDTYLNQVIDLVRNAQESKSRTQDLADRAAFLLTVVALVAGSLTLAAWLLQKESFAFAIERAVTVMVIACPHALGLAIPLVVAVSTSIAARSGLLIRDRQAFERARGIQAVIFDKTGTLTLGTFGVTDVISLSGAGREEILALASSLESRAEHPIAKAVADMSRQMGLNPYKVDRFRLIPGEGIEGFVDGRDLKIVSPGYLLEKGIGLPEANGGRLEELKRQGKTLVVVLEDSKPIGALALADVVREESKAAIQSLKSMGIRCMMLTGDNKFVAQAVAKDLGLDEFFAEVLPKEKATTVQEVQRSYVVAMVGDGVNDAPALASADVGIAIGAGTDVAIETADIVLVRSDPRDVANVISLSRRTYSKMLQNLVWAAGYNVFAIPLAAGVLYGSGLLLSPAAGAVLMSLSTIIVALNARLLRSD